MPVSFFSSLDFVVVVVIDASAAAGADDGDDAVVGFITS